MSRVEPGTLFGRYRLERRLARGGMAEVWLARTEGAAGVSKEVVLKRILGARAQDPHFREMFVGEARVAMELAHGNIAQVFDFGEADGEYYLAMEYVRGRSLFEVLREADRRGLRVPYALSAFAVQEAARGLHYAHLRASEDGRPLGIVHRDVSPQNVLVAFDGQVKVVDFGIARARSVASRTRAGVMKGKYVYFSPEQASSGAVDRRTDVYALGVVLYELVTGRLPVEGELRQVVARIRDGRWARPRMIEPALPEELERIVLEAMAVDPRARTPSAQALEAALGAWLRGSVGAEDLGVFVRHLSADALGEGDAPVPEGYARSLEPWRRTVPELAGDEADLPPGLGATAELGKPSLRTPEAPPRRGPLLLAAALAAAILAGVVVGVTRPWAPAAEVTAPAALPLEATPLPAASRPASPEAPRRPEPAAPPASAGPPAEHPAPLPETMPTHFSVDDEARLVAHLPVRAISVPVQGQPLRWTHLDPAARTVLRLSGRANLGGLVRHPFSRVFYLAVGEHGATQGILGDGRRGVLRGYEKVGFAAADPMGAFDNTGTLKVTLRSGRRVRHLSLDPAKDVLVGYALGVPEIRGLAPDRRYRASLDPGGWTWGAGARPHTLLFVYAFERDDTPVGGSRDVDDTFGALQEGGAVEIHDTSKIRFFLLDDVPGDDGGVVTVRLAEVDPR